MRGEIEPPSSFIHMSCIKLPNATKKKELKLSHCYINGTLQMNDCNKQMTLNRMKQKDNDILLVFQLSDSVRMYRKLHLPTTFQTF